MCKNTECGFKCHTHKNDSLTTQTIASSFIYTSKAAARIQVSNLKYFALKGAEQCSAK